MHFIYYLITIIGITLSILKFSNIYSQPLISYADIVEKVIGGVVNIRTTSFNSKSISKLDPYYFFLNGKPSLNINNKSLGSGILFDKRGYIITNYHVIANASVIEVLFSKTKQKVSASILGFDLKTDIAVLKTDIIPTHPEIHPLDFGNSDNVRVGDIVLAIGNPFGYAHTVTSGIISATGRVLGTGPYDGFLQTDATIHPGNSGGPLIDIRGRVIGVNTAIADEAHGIGFAIPINLVSKVAEQILKYGKVLRPWLGIVGKNILSSDDILETRDPLGLYGVIVTNLIVDSPADKAGIKIGDVLISLDNNKIYDVNHLQQLLFDKSYNDKVVIKLYRRHKGFINLTVNLRLSPAAQELPSDKDLF